MTAHDGLGNLLGDDDADGVILDIDAPIPPEAQDGSPPPLPVPPIPAPDAIPEILRGLSQWMTWRYEWGRDKDGKPVLRKPPCSWRTGGKAAVTNTAAWGTFEEALEAAQRRGHGVGFVFAADDFAGVDLDGCRDPQSGKVVPWVVPIVRAAYRAGCWVEVSPSGEGVHIVGTGLWNAGWNKKTLSAPPIGQKAAAIEGYDGGRYFTVSGIALSARPLPEKPGPIADVVALCMQAVKDDAILKKARRAPNAANFTRLYDDGDTSGYEGNQSDADDALCVHLGYWTDDDPEAMDRLYRSSAFMDREKWDRPTGGTTYGAYTIQKAIAQRAKHAAGGGANTQGGGVGSFGPAPQPPPPPVQGVKSSSPPPPRPPGGAPSKPIDRRYLADVLDAFRRYMHMPDGGPVEVALAAVAANRFQGAPVWLLLVAPPSRGKTEVLNPLGKLPLAHMVSTLTEPSLLSGTARGNTAKTATGGLLRQVGSFGYIIMKDFTTVLAMNKDTRGQVLAALREIYDGSWVRTMGTDGGKVLSWQGKVGLIAGCTPAIDSHHAVISALGERFVLYRLPEVDEQLTTRAALHQVVEANPVDDLTEAVQRLVAALPDDPEPERLRPEDERYLFILAQLGARGRSPVERDYGAHRDILQVPEPEAPARLAQSLYRLWAGALLVGCDRPEAWRLVRHATISSLPAMRERALTYLCGLPPGWRTTSEVAKALRVTTNTAGRVLEDLCAHGLVGMPRDVQLGAGFTFRWRVEQWVRDALAANPPP